MKLACLKQTAMSRLMPVKFQTTVFSRQQISNATTQVLKMPPQWIVRVGPSKIELLEDQHEHFQTTLALEIS